MIGVQNLSVADGDQLMLETLTAFRRAGTDMVLTYFAHRAAQVLGG